MSGPVTPLELRELGKFYGRHVALRGVSLTVSAGEVVGLLGPNGAGKTTLLSIAAGLQAPSEGERQLGAAVSAAVSLEQRGRMAYVGHATQLYPLLTATENLELFEGLRAVADLKTDPLMPWLERLGLAHAADRLVRTFSRGMMQRLCLARAMAGRPELLLLDEPFTALDRDGRHLLTRELRDQAARGVAVLLSSHDLEAMLDATDRVILLQAGEVVGQVARDPMTTYRDRVLGLT